ncbi:MAG: hypothetical protein OXG49_09145 [Chloroflexi bacterium]|nr:hypothetical protein [Chloroflexota bacterium]
MPSNDTNRLTRAEVDFFVENGYLGPYAAMSPAEMAGFRAAIDAHVLDSDGPNPRRPMQSRQMDQPAARSLTESRFFHFATVFGLMP